MEPHPTVRHKMIGDMVQERTPIRKSSEAVGHAVLALYYYAGAADVYAETGEKAIVKALDRLWDNVVNKKMYVTGACGQTHHGSSSKVDFVHEAFIDEYMMPNLTAYNETCANICNAMFSYRMLGIHGESKYADIMELVLYNSALSGISAEGTHYFYTNPLRRIHDHEMDTTDQKTRTPYIPCFCCPPNLVRTIAKVSGWAYSLARNGIAVNLYGGNKLVTQMLDGSRIQLTQDTKYPWNGDVKITIEKCKKEPFDIMLRIPEWAEGTGILLGQSPWSGVVGHVSGTTGPLVANYMVRHSSDVFITGATDLYDGQWHIIGGRLAAGTGDDIPAELFIDEIVAETSGTASVPGTSDCGELTIGAERTGGGEAYDGALARLLIYDRPLSDSEINQTMSALWSTEPNPRAYVPDPADGALHEDTWVNLSWKPGGYAVSHDIYMGDNFDDVDAGAESTFQGNQNDAFIVAGFPGFPFPDGLVPGTTYYWRIDEVNEAEPNSPWKGDIWSLSIPPKTAYFPDPADGAEGVSVDPQLSWTPGFGARLHTVYFGETFDEVDSATGGNVQSSASYSPGTLKMAKTYYWRIDEFDVADTHKGDVWSFMIEGAVSNPDPANGAVDVTQTPIMTWEPGFGATHKVYFGTDATSLELTNSGNLGSESYEPGLLEWNTTYYWRVNEVNSANADSPWKGPLWSFTTANFLVVDDFESYNDLNEDEPGSNRIYLAWIDGFDNPTTNGSVVGHANVPFAEQTIVHNGNQSMPFAYDNAVGKSEATLTLTSNRNWTVNGVTTLTIWIRGSVGNTAEQMYVTLNGSARVNNDNSDAATITRWTAWNIELQKFADQGVNLTNVNSITLGLSSVTGGSGMMYFDDIRLYPPAQ